jgi:Protein of unknown function (DUF1572)
MHSWRGSEKSFRVRIVIMAHQLTTSYIAEAITTYRQYKFLAEAAIGQIADEQLTLTLDPEANSIAHIMKHLAGNLRSRWTDFLTTDGEKPDRNRDAEFESAPITRAELLEMWERGWQCIFTALEALTDDDLTRTVFIRKQPHSVLRAINRSLTHTASHIGQVILLAKHFQSDRWKTLSMPRRKQAVLQDRAAASTTKE